MDPPSSPASSAPSSVLEMYPVEPSEFHDLMDSVITPKIQSMDDSSYKALLSSTLTHLGISDGAWNLMSDISTAESLEQLATHIKTTLLIPCRLL